MTRRATSLRMRLTLIILLPILFVAVIAGAWQLSNARSTAAEVFDRSLMSAALAVARDVEVSGGDALSERTRDILADTSGGTVFYHVYAPDGVIVAGYATPPVGISAGNPEDAEPRYFDASYLGRPVHGVRLQTQAEIDGFSGVFTTTVWQDRQVRTAFVRELMVQPLVGLGGIIVALALIVWFGVKLGLRPLLDLENAIETRSGEELSPIQRAVPHEVEGIVDTLNLLFDQVSKTMATQSEFISNAAHQLRNPIAGVLSLAESISGARDSEEIKRRTDDLLEAAKETSALSKQLLMYERARASDGPRHFSSIDMDFLLREVADEASRGAPDGVDLHFATAQNLPELKGDVVMIKEALRNLIDNAFRHAGDELSQVTISAKRQNNAVTIAVEDDGIGLTDKQLRSARERFVGFSSTSVGGLGLSIAEEVARNHDGSIELRSDGTGFYAAIVLPTA